MNLQCYNNSNGMFVFSFTIDGNEKIHIRIDYVVHLCCCSVLFKKVVYFLSLMCDNVVFIAKLFAPVSLVIDILRSLVLTPSCIFTFAINYYIYMGFILKEQQRSFFNFIQSVNLILMS